MAILNYLVWILGGHWAWADSKVSAVADKNAGLVKIDRKSVEWHRGLIAIPVLEVNSQGVDGLENR